ncbi:box C/D snoRNA protein 1 [Fopius arisanus]|uniref:Box C/D snoRNA protein 1 n=1 Tax=Fopius arisanus TaxID=64838 RepID=A0A9R1T4M0_9HYME|nr:PREDICTED: box C/D snoRNA protein 1 [Fopius arisanus]XP_011302403.1 PREDICTED: box C/D snoRNA protein 1 [Fopius arisanus]
MEKLENCEVCAKMTAKYTCPKCEVRTCSLTCVNIHKKELDCDGIRDKTKFVPLNKFTDLDLLSDYRLLEEVGRSVDQLHRDESKKYGRFRNLPTHLHKLRQAALRSKVQLEFMPYNFSRHKENTTFFNWKSHELFWRIEWIFPQAGNTKWVTQRALETSRISDLLDNILDPLICNEASADDMTQRKVLADKLQFYRSSGLSGIKALLKAEKVKKSDSRFYELDITDSLKENLANKTIIEFPTIYITLKDHADMFEIIDSDAEKEEPEEKSDESMSNWKNRRNNRTTKNIHHDRKVKKEESPVNFFFNNNTSDSSDSENK